MKMYKNLKPLKQSGMASILVTMIVMVIISLIVLSAALLSRREQRQTLDRQLHTQAFYAAESGVNDAVGWLLGPSAGTFLSEAGTTDCNDFTTRAGLSSALSGTAVQYSCLLVDPTPQEWEGTAGSETASIIPLRPRGGGNINTITVAWQDTDGNADFAGCSSTTDLPASGSYSACKTGLLRFDLVNTGAVDRASLNTNIMSGVLQPINSATDTDIAFVPVNIETAGEQARIHAVACRSSLGGGRQRYCQARFTGLNAASYQIRVRSLYRSSVLHVSAASGGTTVELLNAQAVIDATGRAQDILRRVSVRVPLSTNRSEPDFAIQTTEELCKRLQVSGGSATDTECTP